MADTTTATADPPADKCKGSGAPPCCECCTEIFEVRSLYRQDARRLTGIMDLALTQAVENSGRVSAMMAIRSAQPNPVEASAMADIKNSTSPQTAQSNALVSQMYAGIQGLQAQLGTLVAMLANLANSTPSSPGSAREQAQMPPVVVNTAAKP